MTAPKPPYLLAAFLQRRFAWLYFILGFVLLIALAVLVVALILLFHMKKMDTHFNRLVGNSTGSEPFMRLYEDFNAARGKGRKQATEAQLLERLSPDQLSQARAYGMQCWKELHYHTFHQQRCGYYVTPLNVTRNL